MIVMASILPEAVMGKRALTAATGVVLRVGVALALLTLL